MFTSRGAVYSVRMNRTLSIVAVALALVITTTQAEVRLPALFGDHMVLQRDAAVPVWGWAEPDEAVTVSIGGQTANTTADENGRWRIDLRELQAGGPHTLTVKGKASTITLEDVLIGDVWL